LSGAMIGKSAPDLLPEAPVNLVTDISFALFGLLAIGAPLVWALRSGSPGPPSVPSPCPCPRPSWTQPRVRRKRTAPTARRVPGASPARPPARPAAGPRAPFGKRSGANPSGLERARARRSLRNRCDLGGPGSRCGGPGATAAGPAAPHLRAVRVIAGTYRGRELVAPPGRETRPTSDRVRESLFSILGAIDGDRSSTSTRLGGTGDRGAVAWGR